MDKTPKYELEPQTKKFLRLQAEEIVRGKVAFSEQNLDALAPAAARELVHELQVHQIELEMQNEELRKTQLELEEMRARYFDLYDLAPISYCTINESGVILEANLAAAQLLGEKRGQLVGQRISHFISKEFQDTYYLCRKLLMTLSKLSEQQSCELHMIKADSTAFWVNITISHAQDSNGDTVQRMVLTDITSTKVMSLAMQESESHLRTLVDNLA